MQGDGGAKWDHRLGAINQWRSLSPCRAMLGDDQLGRAFCPMPTEPDEEARCPCFRSPMAISPTGTVSAFSAKSRSNAFDGFL